MGAPSKYNPSYMPRVAESMKVLGATDVEIAEALGISIDSLWRWKNKYKEFSESLKKSSHAYKADAVLSLHKRIVGYEYEEEEKRYNKKGELIGWKITKKHVIPDVAAIMSYMTNVWGWRHKTSSEITGKDGAPLIRGELTIIELPDNGRSDTINK